MCVKEFLGYNCGHCSIPNIRQCPLSASNPVFPVCKYPAERPIFTNEYCHPCSRVVWNIKVLKEEEEHRVRHMNGECGCEVVFDGEVREKKVRARGGKGNGKGKARVLENEHSSQAAVEGDEKQKPAQSGIEEPAQMAITEDTASTRGTLQNQTEEYLGYYYSSQDQMFTTSSGTSNGYSGQLMINSPGAGMRFYPAETLHFQSTTLSVPRALKVQYTASEADKESLSLEPGEAEHDRDVEVQGNDLLQPLVVSSDMARPELT